MNITKNNMFRLVTNTLKGCNEIVPLPDKRSAWFQLTKVWAYTMSWGDYPKLMIATLYPIKKGPVLEIEIYESGRPVFRMTDYPSPWQLQKLGMIGKEE